MLTRASVQNARKGLVPDAPSTRTWRSAARLGGMGNIGVLLLEDGRWKESHDVGGKGCDIDGGL